jgi:CDP-glucose 4,6-dehydratase
MFDAIAGSELCSDIRGDIRNGDRVEAALQHAGPEIVIHMAAQSLVRRSYAEPVVTFDVNVLGTAKLLDACRRCDSVRAVVVVTTDKCYENIAQATPFQEGDRLGGKDAYSASKACAELVTQSYRHSFFDPAASARPSVAVASARAGNVLGGGDWATDRLVPDAVRAFAAGRALSIRNPSAIRPWQHVIDPLAGYLLLAQALIERGPEFSSAWNFGPTEVATVRRVAAIFATAWGPQARVEEQQSPDALYESQQLLLDSTRARTLLGWYPAKSLERTLVDAAEWYSAFHQHASPAELRALALTQITSSVEAAV